MAEWESSGVQSQFNQKYEYQCIWWTCKKIVFIEPANISWFSGEVPGVGWVHFAHGLGIAVVPKVHFGYRCVYLSVLQDRHTSGSVCSSRAQQGWGCAGQGEVSLCRAGAPALPSPIHPSPNAIWVCHLLLLPGLGAQSSSQHCWSSSAPMCPLQAAPISVHAQENSQGMCQEPPGLGASMPRDALSPLGCCFPRAQAAGVVLVPFLAFEFHLATGPEKGIGHFNVIPSSSRNERLKFSNEHLNSELSI